jgi:class 3 adenylate cyclase
MGIGLDVGDAFVGNIGQRALYDFTGGGEVVLSQRVAEGLPSPVGERATLELKGKREPQIAYRFAV